MVWAITMSDAILVLFEFTSQNALSLKNFEFCMNNIILISLFFSQISGIPDGSKPLDQGTLTISGLHLNVVSFTKMSFFTDKKEVRRSSTALGYVAHVCYCTYSFSNFNFWLQLAEVFVLHLWDVYFA